MAFVALLSAPSVAQTPAAAGEARVIVKYRADSPLLRRLALAAGGPRADAQALGRRLGLLLRAGAEVADRTHVIRAGGMTSRELASRLARESDIEYAVPDQRRRRLAAPNDPLYLAGPAVGGGAGGPAAGQWYLRAPAGEVQSSLDVETAWDYTTGNSSIVVAVIDTGVRFDHPDLLHIAAGGNLLPGYDMISDVDVANDGDGRDADPSDPGDWLTLDEVQLVGGPFEDCASAAEDSSWHGTQISGLIGALTNNGLGMASVGRNVRVLPVRGLGKCGGFDSDIIAGMRWAVGLPVAGVPFNPTPARVLNLSLGGDGACEWAYRDALAEITALGAVVVAAAGNSAGHAVSTPANCPGVIAVGGLRHVGTKVGFSDLGPEIALGAPAGNCVDVGFGDPCRYPILTTSNAGTTTPRVDAAGGSIYTDSFNASVGTSFAAPLVAGTAALMLSAQPALTPFGVRTLLQGTARPFPIRGAENADGAPVPQCTAPRFNGSTPVDQLQCYCTTATCGAGMLDAGAAVAAALGLQARITVSPGSPVAGAAVTLSGAQSVVASGRNIVAYQWAITDGGGIVTGFTGAADSVTALVVPSSAGRFSTSLTVTDSTGLRATTKSTLDVSAPIDGLNFQGLWWNAPAGSEAGWGINFAHQGDVIFATWFTYDANGRAWWLSMTAERSGANTFAGTLYRTRGPAYSAVPFDPAQVQRIPVGGGTLTFIDGNNGGFAYTVNGITQTKSITRQVFGPLPTCTFGGQPNLALATNYQDLWYAAPAASESGWGINLAHQGDTIFATWFTYDVDGTPMWLSATLGKVGARAYTGALIRTSGPAFNAVPFNPNAVTRSQAGTATITFANGNAASFAYEVNDRANVVLPTKAITRQVFRAPGTGCQ
jgi:serine protease